MRVAFLGSAEVSVVVLGALVAAGHELAVVVTEPDRRRGRGGALMPTPTKALAESLRIPVSEVVEDALDAGAEVGVVVAFGRLVRPHALARMPFLNVHFSLLPRWRGAAPVERAILAGDGVTGVSLMLLDEGLDSGPVFEERAVAIEPHEHAASLRHRLAVTGAELLVERLAGGLASLGSPLPQVGEPTYAAKLAPEELEIDWELPAEQIERVVRVGRAWTRWRQKRLIVWDARAVGEPSEALPAGGTSGPGTLHAGSVATGDGWLELVEVQPEGRARQPIAAWWNGARPEVGEGFAGGITAASRGDRSTGAGS